jgi:hypothetical protein
MLEILFWVAIAVAVFWFLRWASTLEKPPEPRQTASRFTESKPSIKDWEGEDDRAPNKVEHELVFVAPERRFEYEVLATWYNRDPYAESDESTVHKKYDVRRGSDGGWEIRQVQRNYRTIDGHPWESAPKRLVRSWEAAYRKTVSNDATVDSDSSAGPTGSG